MTPNEKESFMVVSEAIAHAVQSNVKCIESYMIGFAKGMEAIVSEKEKGVQEKRKSLDEETKKFLERERKRWK